MPNISRVFIVIAALSLMVATQLSAYGFHGLASKVPAADLHAWEFATQIQFYHSLGLFLVALMLQQVPRSILLKLAGGLMVLGTVLFSGSVYARTLGAPASIGPIALWGGVSCMLAWLLTAIAGFRAR